MKVSLNMDVALNAALCQLGFQPLDILDRLELGHLPMWTNALQWKFNGEGHRFGLEQFNQLTSDFDVGRFDTSIETLVVLPIC